MSIRAIFILNGFDMKKNSTIVFFVTLSFGVFAQQADTIAMTGCNFNTPGWGESLGVVSFHTDSTWAIVGNGITQFWSDAVTATACQKAVFDGGFDNWMYPAHSDFNADCRSNPDFPGDLFSWCAVVRFADSLCFYPWRVPTMKDFIDLDIAIGGTGNGRDGVSPFVTNGYINLWGGTFGGVSLPSGTLDTQGTWGAYWSQTDGNDSGAHCFGFTTTTTGIVGPQLWGLKNFGFTLRCVLTSGL